MANTSYGVNHANAVKLWSRKLFREALKKTWASKFMGSDSGSICQVVEDTSKSPGDRVRVILRMLLSGDGILGDGTLEGNEEALTTYTDDVFIDQLRHAVRSGGKMSEQRIPFSVREEARSGLEDWWADRIDSWFMNQLAGSRLNTGLHRTGLQAAIEPSANNIVYGPTAAGHTTEGSVGSASATNVLTLSMINNLVLKAKTLTPQIRPVKVDGNDYFVMFIHPEQTFDLRNDASTAGNWIDIQKAAMNGGDVSNNPIFTGSLGVYNGVILHESTRIPRGGSTTGGTVVASRRAVFAGAQALSMAYGRGFGGNRMSWVEELFDYRNQLGVSAGMIAGMKKMQFNSQDFSTIVQVTGITRGS